MNARRPESDDEILARALTEGPHARAELARTRPDLAARMRELDALEIELDLVAAESRRESLTTAGTTDADRERVRAFVHGRLAERRTVPSARSSPRRWRSWALTLAAAVVLVALVVKLWAPVTPGEPPTRVLLGASGLRPVDTTVADEVAWEPVGARYLVRVERVAPAADGTTLLFERKQTETRWAPTEEQRATWPTRIRVEVAVLDESGQPTAAHISLELSLSRSAAR